jgi:hypothetical protein
MFPDIQNPGSALGEAIGADMENALNVYLTTLVEEHGYHFITESPIPGKKKLLLHDSFGNLHNIDSVIANEQMQPIILLESKYIRYKKHNRDKASWLCTAHPAVRRRYASIRSSIAVLAGNWSLSSLAMLKSNEVNVFLIPFSLTCDLLRDFGIDFNWGEKERDKAVAAWKKYSALTDSEKATVGTAMIEPIKPDLRKLVLSILDDTADRKISEVVILLHSNLGEVKEYRFGSIREAVDFLNASELEGVFITTDSLTLFDPAPTFDDEGDEEFETE